MIITSYEAICNLGNNINDIYRKALEGNITCFEASMNYIKEKKVRLGKININLPDISYNDYNLRCNKLAIKCLELIKQDIENTINKYSKERISIVVATTNSGVQEYEKSNNPKHFELSNPAEFLHKYLKLKGCYLTVSTACSSGLKAFSAAGDILNSKISDAVIIVCVDTLSKVPVYGFDSLEVLSEKQSVPFSKNRCGMNIAEACSVFITERESDKGIKILGYGESSDIFHTTTPNPTGNEAIKAILQALDDAQIKPQDIDYINAHGTGTIANDIMEANAIYSIFKDSVPVSSTKPLTGHCLGAAAGIETALCCKLIDNFYGNLYPHIYDNNFDESLPKIKLVNDEIYDKCEICMCNSFGFGGTNSILIIGK